MEKIEIHNFRCFRHLAVGFTPGVNLLIGDNASGKTSLLMACKYAVSSFFSGFSDQYTVWAAPRKEDFLKFAAGEKRFNTQAIRLDYSFFADEFLGLEGSDADLGKQTLICKNEKNRRPLISGLARLRDYGRFLAEDSLSILYDGSILQKVPLPLFASFSTHGIHMQQKVISKYFNDIHQTPSFGYYMCHSTDGLLPHWVRRMLILKEADANPVERAIVMNALRSMFGPGGCGVIDDLDPRVNYKDIICRFTDGREIPSAMLSDGYKRLFSIVIDLAFRCALLNSVIYGEEAALRTTGTVIIDEIDLHLHPSLQAVVLKALQAAFPALQFITSTHAPMVMSGVEDNGSNSVLYMAYRDGDYSITEVDTFGMDLSTLAESVLQVPSRNPSVKVELDRLATYIDDEDFGNAKRLLASLKERFGDRIPELSGFDTQITVEETLR